MEISFLMPICLKLVCRKQNKKENAIKKKKKVIIFVNFRKWYSFEILKKKSQL